MPVDQTRDNEAGTVEAVIGQNSSLVGMTPRSWRCSNGPASTCWPSAAATSASPSAWDRSASSTATSSCCTGNLQRLPELLRELDCLPLVRRSLRLGSIRRGLLPLAILLGAVAATALGMVPVALAFFAAAALMVLAGALPLRDIYEQLDAPDPDHAGGAHPGVRFPARDRGHRRDRRLALDAGGTLPPFGAVVLILVAAMAVTPFLNNAATVLVMAPIAAAFATGLGYRPEAFLMAVAIGAGCDFLTPIGHQCNTLVMGRVATASATMPGSGCRSR